MNRYLKWLFVSVAIIFSGVVFVAAISGVVFYKTLPQPSAQINLEGLSASTETVFDKHGVPHITASNMPDAMQVLGYVHARDRLWQMEFLRRVGEGRLSEFLGEPTLDTDIFLRTLDMAGASRKSYDKLLPETKIALEAYTAGVNSYLTRPTKMFETNLGAEFLILGHNPEPWEAWNSILILKVMGLTLSGNMDREIQRLSLAARGFPTSEINEVIPIDPSENAPQMPDLRELYGFGVAGKFRLSNLESEQKLKTAKTAPEFEWPTGRSASNNWVVSGAVTASGKPILANDPHLGLTAPSAFYLAHLSWDDEGRTRNIIGGTLPGIPFVIAGRNSRVAWGLTTTNLDSQDIFLEKLDPEASDRYKTEFGWAKLEETEVEIKVSGSDPVMIKRRASRHGPILPDGFRDIKKHLPNGMLASLSWTGLADDDTSVDTLYLNGMAENVDDVLLGMDRAVSPMQSVVIADIDGDIALATPGRLPVRNKVNRIKGRAPVPGWLFKYRWERPIQSSNVPRFTDPVEGAFATANANFFPPDYPHHITYDWAERFRQERVEDLVFELPGEHTIATSRRIMADDYSQAFLKLVQLTVRQARPSAGRVGDIIHSLARWDGRMRKNRAEPLIVLALFRHLHSNIFKDDLGENYKLFERGRITRVLNILEGGTERDWCNDRGTGKTETCSEIITKSLNEALLELETLQGRDWRSWKYGETHKAFSEHRPFGSVEPLAQFFNIEVPSSGGPYTLHRGQTHFGKEGPYRSRHGGAYRAIYDLADLDNSLYIVSTGQSGNFLSNHYSDLAPKWSNSEFLKMSTAVEDYKQESIGTWVFRP